jgi:hypothetical protein
MFIDRETAERQRVQGAMTDPAMDGHCDRLSPGSRAQNCSHKDCRSDSLVRAQPALTLGVVSKYSVDALRLVFQAGPSAPG